MQSKILSFDTLLEKVKEAQEDGKRVVQSQGIFDLIHPGIIIHLDEAKEQGDILVVTVVDDKSAKKNPGRPVFPANMRAENVAALSQVDYVSVVDEDEPYDSVKKLKPDVFAKGRYHLDRDKKIHGEKIKEDKKLYFCNSLVYETKGFYFSSSQIKNSLLDLYPESTKAYLKQFSEKYPFEKIVEKVDSLKSLKVLLLGDGIIDEYHYCTAMGKSAKSPIVVNKYVDHDVFAGGAFAIANHLAGVCGEIHLVSLLGSDDSREEFVANNIKHNISTKFFYRDNSTSIIKKRYIDKKLNQKLFEINYLNDEYIKPNLESELINYLDSILSDYDVVMVSDFGHGLVTPEVIDFLSKRKIKLAVNTQTNGANAGYNLITKYKSPKFICLDESEARLATQERFGDINDVAIELLTQLEADHIIITLGKTGSVSLSKANGGPVTTPIFSSQVLDTVGAGDAFFSYTSPCYAMDMEEDFVSFLGNVAGALAVRIIGNKRPVEKHELLEFVHAILR